MMKQLFRMMLTALGATLCLPAWTQEVSTAPRPQAEKAPIELSVTYSTLRSNAPVGGCGCFWMAGGAGALAVPVWHSVAAVAEVSGEHTGDMLGGRELSLAFVMGGARIGHSMHRRYVPFAQALFGNVHGFDSQFPESNRLKSSANAFAMVAGGGLDISISHHFLVRAVEADYQYMQLPNNATDQQHDIRLSAGIVYRFQR